MPIFTDVLASACNQLQKIYNLKLYFENLLEFILFSRFLKVKRNKAFGEMANKKILVVKPDGIGDVVLCTPFLRELKKAFPKSSVKLVVGNASKNLVELCPYIEEVICYDNEWSHFIRAARNLAMAIKFSKKTISIHRMNIGIFPRWDSDRYYAGLIILLSGAGRRITYSSSVSSWKTNFNSSYDKLYTDLLVNGEGKHEVERNLDILRYLGKKVKSSKLELWFSKADAAFVKETMKDNAIKPGRKIVAIGIGARQPRRRWPIERYIEIADWIKDNSNSNIVIVGGEPNVVLDECMKKVDKKRIFNLCGRFTLRQLGVMLSKCAFFVGNDSGPKHLAAAVGCPTIEISCHSLNADPEGPNSPLRFSAWGNKTKILQPEISTAACSNGCVAYFPHCILGIDSGEVKKAVKEFLN